MIDLDLCRVICGRIADDTISVLRLACHSRRRHNNNESVLVPICKLFARTDNQPDYVSAVVGIFIVFVSVLWLFKRKSYQGPVSSHRS